MIKPDLDLFGRQTAQTVDEMASIEAKTQIINTTFENFKVGAQVVSISSGPVITRYELELEKGVKVSHVKSLKDELSLILKTKRIHISPISGESKIGIEIPNDNPEIIYIRDVLETDEFHKDMKIPIVLGFDTSGKPRVTDLAKTPHLLVAGQTGAGKSVGVNSFLTSILYSRTPQEVELLLIDPKIVELSPYNGIPHLVEPVITDPDKALDALKWACEEMDKRYHVLSALGARNIEGFNEKSNEKMSYLVILIDEFADLMMTAGKQIETYIVRIAQKARAVGIHLIVTTQRPTIDVITGTIKANLPSRIGFQTASQVDSRTIIDHMGCESLVGNGDMLFCSAGSPTPERIHGSWVTTEEVEAIVEHWKNQVIEEKITFTTNDEDDEDVNELDMKFEDAARLVVRIQRVTRSLLQRTLMVDYNKSEKLVKQLELTGIVSPEMGNNPREVLVDEPRLEEILSKRV